ncbi:hypothetical protein, partial [Streptomyces clavuligerus]|uniref:hypothetical protein n=1 Tax=Streptomyces clavuligerus TaxID=1901 RepID=UPI001E623541
MTLRRVLRMVLVAGVVVLALVLLLSLGGKGNSGGGESRDPARTHGDRREAGPLARPTPPPGYAAAHRWETGAVSLEYALAPSTGRIAHLERVPGGDGDRFRVRARDLATGRTSWTGAVLRPVGAAGDPGATADSDAADGTAGEAAVPYPRLLPVAKEGREYFAVWSFGRTNPFGDADRAGPGGTGVVLELYAAADGRHRQVELPWPDAPAVSGDGPGVLVTDGGTRSAVVDPASGEVSEIRGKALGYPRGCAGCRRLTEVRGLTARGLLVGGESGFWVRGGWYSARVAPPGAAPSSGVAAAVAPGHLLAKWRPAPGRPDARTHEIWAVHDTRTGRVLASTRCHRPEIEPGEHPRAALAPGGGHLVAGHLAFDLRRKKGYCFDQSDGAPPLVLTTVTDTGTAYGAVNARGPVDALAGGGVQLQDDAGSPETGTVGVTEGVGAAEGPDGEVL